MFGGESFSAAHFGEESCRVDVFGEDSFSPALFGELSCRATVFGEESFSAAFLVTNLAEQLFLVKNLSVLLFC